MRLGDVLKRYRLHADKDQRSMAAEMLISASSLCRIENGKSPDALALLRILTWMLNKERKEKKKCLTSKSPALKD